MRRGMTWRLGILAAIALVLTSGLGATGCFRRVRRPAATSAAAAPSDFTAHALPIYRLVTSEVLIDSPSRLLVLQVRLESLGPTTYAFAPQDLRIALPDGSQARVFDRPRAIELLRRTAIADADFNYLLRDDHVPGGIAPYSRQPIADLVGSRLLAEGVFGAGQALQGYAVIDIGSARMSLDGTVVEVTAHRLTDSVPSRSTYQLATSPAASEAR